MMHRLRSTLFLSCGAHLLYGGLIALLAFLTLQFRCETVEECARFAGEYPLTRLSNMLWALYGVICVMVDKRIDTVFAGIEEKAEREVTTYQLLTVKWFTKAFSWTPFVFVVGVSVVLQTARGSPMFFSLIPGSPLVAVLRWTISLLILDQFLEWIRHPLRRQLPYLIAAAIFIIVFSFVPMSYVDSGVVICVVPPVAGRFRYAAHITSLFQVVDREGGELEPLETINSLPRGAGPSSTWKRRVDGNSMIALIGSLVAACLRGIALTLLVVYLHHSWSALPHMWQIGYCTTGVYFLAETVRSVVGNDRRLRRS